MDEKPRFPFSHRYIHQTQRISSVGFVAEGTFCLSGGKDRAAGRAIRKEWAAAVLLPVAFATVAQEKQISGT